MKWAGVATLLFAAAARAEQPNERAVEAAVDEAATVSCTGCQSKGMKYCQGSLTVTAPHQDTRKGTIFGACVAQNETCADVRFGGWNDLQNWTADVHIPIIGHIGTINSTFTVENVTTSGEHCTDMSWPAALTVRTNTTCITPNKWCNIQLVSDTSTFKYTGHGGLCLHEALQPLCTPDVYKQYEESTTWYTNYMDYKGTLEKPEGSTKAREDSDLSCQTCDEGVWCATYRSFSIMGQGYANSLGQGICVPSGKCDLKSVERAVSKRIREVEMSNTTANRSSEEETMHASLKEDGTSAAEFLSKSAVASYGIAIKAPDYDWRSTIHAVEKTSISCSDVEWPKYAMAMNCKQCFQSNDATTGWCEITVSGSTPYGQCMHKHSEDVICKSKNPLLLGIDAKAEYVSTTWTDTVKACDGAPSSGKDIVTDTTASLAQATGSGAANVPIEHLVDSVMEIIDQLTSADRKDLMAHIEKKLAAAA